jgi:hypothetical protein
MAAKWYDWEVVREVTRVATALPVSWLLNIVLFT